MQYYSHRITSDVLLGKNCGLITLLVGSGVNSAEDVKKLEASKDPEQRSLCPDYYAESLGRLFEVLNRKYQ